MGQCMSGDAVEVVKVVPEYDVGKPVRKVELVAPPACAGCGEGFEGRSAKVNNFGKSWHVECYVCKGCGHGNRLRQEAFLHEGGLYCAEHYRERTAEACTSCGKPITGKKIRPGPKSVLHQECYRCSTCGMSLVGKDALKFEDKILCKVDYARATQHCCNACKKPIVGDFVLSMGEKFHPRCLVCTVCSEPIPTGGTFVEHSGRVYCELHDPDTTLLTCAVCDKSLTGKPHLRNLWGEPYCERHENKLRSCKTCGTEVCAVPEDPEANKSVCVHCRQGANRISDDEVADVIRVLKDIGVELHTDYKVVLKEKVAHKYGGMHHQNSDDMVSLVVNKTLPRESALLALAHAVAHACLEGGVRREFIEPVARYAEYYYLSSWRAKDGQGTVLREDAHYRREKLQHDKQLVKFDAVMKESLGSAKQVIVHLRETGYFPGLGEFLHSEEALKLPPISTAIPAF